MSQIHAVVKDRLCSQTTFVALNDPKFDYTQVSSLIFLVLLVSTKWEYISTMYEARWGTFALLNDGVSALLVQRFPLWLQMDLKGR